jgi:hypothetical protein
MNLPRLLGQYTRVMSIPPKEPRQVQLIEICVTHNVFTEMVQNLKNLGFRRNKKRGNG